MDEQKKTTVEELKEFYNSMLAENLIKNNAVEFESNGLKYRVRTPSYKEKSDAYSFKNQKFVELLKNPNCMLDIDLRKLYKERGISIDELDKTYNLLEKQKNDLKYKLGEGLKEQGPDNILETYKKEIENLQLQQTILASKRTSYMESSIEYQIFIAYYTYLTYLIAEKCIIGKDLGEGKKEEDTWVKLWNSLEEMEKDDEKFVNLVSTYCSVLFQDDFKI